MKFTICSIFFGRKKHRTKFFFSNIVTAFKNLTNPYMKTPDLIFSNPSQNGSPKKRFKYFTLKEFDSPDELNSGFKMNIQFLELLDFARELAGIPFKISSGYRTEKHNALVGGRVGSSHLKGLAADIHYSNSSERYLILSSLIQCGARRIGLGKTFIHVDVDEAKSQNVMWTYDY